MRVLQDERVSKHGGGNGATWWKEKAGPGCQWAAGTRRQDCGSKGVNSQHGGRRDCSAVGRTDCSGRGPWCSPSTHMGARNGISSLGIWRPLLAPMAMYTHDAQTFMQAKIPFIK